ncbi:Asp23/Gls24 family envelope stress response protein [Pseudonocardia spinosispora]|uniref:Asp23/Gls24 family envelope stress response protein n=1 Tax=Pseudonocardia spinosispora TaxID=103441 RepID=UPI000405BAB1|nr:Asp23/Gls24 family envelope stress response protein [Pseudonocardia spinosispora]
MTRTATASTSTASESQNDTVSVSALTSDQGQTRVADVVVSKIAGLAAREVPGVYALGGGAARAFDALRERIPGATSNVSHGVSVEVGERQTAVDLNVVVEYGVGLVEVAAGVRRNVIGAIERMTGLQVVEVNIAVGDVHLPADDDTPAPIVPSIPRVA